GRFLRSFELRFASWEIEGVVLDVVVVEAGRSVNIDTVDEEDAAEVDKLLDVAGAISIKGIGG
ncbi:hypothetical protein TNCV_3675921, partial [Trichonephila clavipes]